MKNITTKSLTILLMIFIIMACGKKEEKLSGTDLANTQLQSIDLKGEKVNFTYKFAKGNILKYKVTTYTSSDESIQADSLMKSHSNQSVVYYFDIEVLDVDTDSIAELKLNVTQIQVDADLNGQKLAFDTGKNPSQEDQQKFMEYASMHNTPFRARLNNKGEVIEISRLDKMIDKMYSLQPQPQPLTAEQKAQVAKSLSEQAIRPITQLIFREFPNKPMGKDSSWTKVSPTQLSVFKVETKVRYSVDNFVNINDSRAAKIGANLSITFEGRNKGEENGIRFNFNDPKVYGNGEMIFNFDKGLLMRSQTETNVELTVHLEGKDSMQKMVKSIRRDKTKNRNTVELL